VHRLSQTGEEAVDVRVSYVVDSDVGMAVLCEAKVRRPVLFLASLS
jgi:hypothetical protein